MSIREALSFPFWDFFLYFYHTKTYQSIGWAAVNVQAEDRVARNILTPITPHAE
jgi:hypothetical protein